jgi:hypothetical protein
LYLPEDEYFFAAISYLFVTQKGWWLYRHFSSLKEVLFNKVTLCNKIKCQILLLVYSLFRDSIQWLWCSQFQYYIEMNKIYTISWMQIKGMFKIKATKYKMYSLLRFNHFASVMQPFICRFYNICSERMQYMVILRDLKKEFIIIVGDTNNRNIYAFMLFVRNKCRSVLDVLGWYSYIYWNKRNCFTHELFYISW